MKKIFEKWWDHGNKQFSIYNFKDIWKRHGIKPKFHIYDNGAKKKLGDRCYDLNIVIGYTIINYTNFNL